MEGSNQEFLISDIELNFKNRIKYLFVCLCFFFKKSIGYWW